MQMRRLLNLPEKRQADLRYQYPWLRAVVEDEKHPPDLEVMSLTGFDHWLSRDEANEFLENIPQEDQAARTARIAHFCALLVSATPVLSFAFRGRAHDRAIFRKFTSQEALSNYCTPGGAKTFGHRHFQIVLPELDCAFFEGWDDTHQFYFTNSAGLGQLHEWAEQSSLHLIKHG